VTQAPQPQAVPTYTVKPGDTLYSISKQFGQDYKQVAAWNGIDDTYHIHVDQVLRMGPPDAATGPAVAEATPVGNGAVEQKPLGAPDAAPAGTPATSAPPPAATNDAPLKTQPLGLKVPYSETAVAELARAESAEGSTNTASPPSALPPGLTSNAPSEPAAPANLDEAAIGWIWPAKGPLLSEFNDPKNKGIDIAGKMGDPVLASGSGTVIYVGQGLRGLGNLVVVKHTEGLISVYAHNSKILVANNQPVKRGEQIAEMGNSDSEKVELHFEIRRQGAPVDPLKYLPGR
jgi:lipoprotein NlpD